MAKVRHATAADIPALLVLGAEMHAESRYRGTRYSEAKVRTLLADLIGGMGCVLVYERGGEIVGYFAGSVMELYFSEDKFAFDYFLWVHPEHRGGFGGARLVSTFIAWAKSRGATFIDIGISTGVTTERTGALYERLGLGLAGALYSTMGK
jgi:GNAT superfamily N-acetyltransferase